MTDPVINVKSDHCRQPSIIESVGTVLSNSLRHVPMRAWFKNAYHGVLNLQSGGKGIECKLPEGENVRVLPAFRHLSWNMVEYYAFRNAIKPDGIALDIGANAGCYTLLLGQWVGPAGRVFAFEPAPETYAGLCRHIELNNLSEVVTPVQVAVSDSCATANFLAHDHQGMNRLVEGGEAADDSNIVQVPTTTIDDFCARQKIIPDLIKIDVEGFELAVLRGARETIKACGKNLSLFVEMHPTTWDEIGLTKQDIIDELDHQGLGAFPLREMNDMWSVEGECLRIQAR